MKRFLAILLVLVLFAGAAYHAYDYLISRPDIKNLDKVKENLENAGYSVTLLDSEDDLAGGFLPDGSPLRVLPSSCYVCSRFASFVSFLFLFVP